MGLPLPLGVLNFVRLIVGLEPCTMHNLLDLPLSMYIPTFMIESEGHVHECLRWTVIFCLVTFEQNDGDKLNKVENDRLWKRLVVYSLQHHQVLQLLQSFAKAFGPTVSS